MQTACIENTAIALLFYAVSTQYSDTQLVKIFDFLKSINKTLKGTYGLSSMKLIYQNENYKLRYGYLFLFHLKKTKEMQILVLCCIFFFLNA